LSKLRRLGHADPLSYELHIPFPVEKVKLAKIIKYSDILWRSIYGNIFEVGGFMISDVKVYSSSSMSFKSYDYMSGSLPFLSTNDSSFSEVEENLLKHSFNQNTIYEKN
jgi:hypothetical protein